MNRLRRWPPLLEAVLLAALAGSWLVATVSASQSLDSLPPGSRTYVLDLHRTDGRLGPALVLGLGGAVLVTLRHLRPTLAFGMVAVVVLILESRYPYVTRAQFATSIMLLVTAFWALWRTRRFGPMAGVVLAVGVASTIPGYAVARSIAATTIGAAPRPMVDIASFTGTVETVLLLGVAVVAAALVRRFDSQAAELAERNRELTDERLTSARAAVLDERVRIARELHDVVAHHVTTMTVHAGAARQVLALGRTSGATDRTPAGPAEGSNGEPPQRFATSDAARQCADAFGQIEQSGRDAVTELQQLLGFLRGGDETDSGAEDRAPAPTLRHLDRLTDAAGSGFRIRWTVEGDLGAVPPSVDRSAYRIVQESLTNSMKHSGADGAEVEIRVEPSSLHLRIEDRGPAGGPAAPTSGSGNGLVGMRERVLLHGGRCEVGPRPGGGWRVEVDLPYAEPTSSPTGPIRTEAIREAEPK